MTQRDPNGIAQHEPGAKLDAGKPLAWLCISGFSRALQAVADVTTYGANKYTPNGWLSVENGYERYSEAMVRHLLAESADGSMDPESNLPHAAHAAWNALARLEFLLGDKP